MKKIILAAVLAASAVVLTGCVPSAVASSITKEDRAEFEATCYEVRGTFSGNGAWEVPTCSVFYKYPSVPARVTTDER